MKDINLSFERRWVHAFRRRSEHQDTWFARVGPFHVRFDSTSEYAMSRGIQDWPCLSVGAFCSFWYTGLLIKVHFRRWYRWKWGVLFNYTWDHAE